MGRKCTVYKCRSGYRNQPEDQKVAVYKFPKETAKRKAWAASLPNELELEDVTDFMGVCALHWPEHVQMEHTTGRGPRPAVPPSIFQEVTKTGVPSDFKRKPRPATKKTTSKSRAVDVDPIDAFFVNEKISVEEFINLIHARPGLWQKSHPDFCNREVRNRLLDEVRCAADMPAAECAKKLKNLKDSMRAQVAKLPKTKYGLPAFESSDNITWPFFKRMLFMKNEFLGRKIVPSSLVEFDEVEDQEDASEAEQMDNTDEEPGITYTVSELSPEQSTSSDTPQIPTTQDTCRVCDQSLNSSTATTNTHNKRRRLHNHSTDFDFEDERKPVVLDRVTTTDELDTFALDIANDLRKIKDPLKLMQAKAGIRRIAEEFVMNELTSTS
ncbi:uncharacterized protein LOC106011113 [Aplysia californica]|uniref:Uncharacterized protein LOC106011113 n=1 Tax=Aplysia californica TaxID=6500 RepID=A0ABM1VPD5_APLCA|nr:uncharacterized protein LOC106011113 [Aplysia californica]